MPSLLIHSIVNIRIAGWVIVVYRLEKEVKPRYNQQDLHQVVNKFRADSDPYIPDLLCALASCTRVMQIEIRDPNGDGFHTALIPDREIQEGGPKGPDGKQQPTTPITLPARFKEKKG